MGFSDEEAALCVVEAVGGLFADGDWDYGVFWGFEW